MARARNPLEGAIHALSTALARSGRPSMIIGGIAVIARGVPRVTRDVDATIAGEATDLPALLAVLERQGIRPRIDDAVAFARETQVLLLRHEPTGVDVDLSLAWLPFELEALARAETIDLARTRVRAARPEDLVIYKAIAWRPQDQQDVERLVALHAASMDLTRVRRVVRELAAALDEPERAAAVERLIVAAMPSGVRAATRARPKTSAARKRPKKR